MLLIAEQRSLSMDEIVSYCKSRGFIFTGSEIYGSIGTGFDYGPLGVQLKKNIQDKWWADFVSKRRDCVGIESAIIMNPKGKCSSVVNSIVDANRHGEYWCCMF
jgi:glycyl-tRNA synthetase (class II)